MYGGRQVWRDKEDAEGEMEAEWCELEEFSSMLEWKDVGHGKII